MYHREYCWEGVLVDHGAGKYDEEMAGYADKMGPGSVALLLMPLPFFKLVYISSSALVPWTLDT